HHVHLVACCYYKDARVHCEVLKIRSVPHVNSAYRLARIAAAEGSGVIRSGGSMLMPDPSGPNSVPEIPSLSIEVPRSPASGQQRSEEHTSELQSRFDLVCRLLLEKKKG